jgi:hypothetical protein
LHVLSLAPLRLDRRFVTLSCESCFLERHRSLPLHWAEQWQSDQRFFRRCEMSTFSPALVIKLGHAVGVDCKYPDVVHKTWTIVHTNGIHNTTLQYCACKGAPDRLSQLLSARLFPATTRNPQTVFTFDLLKAYNVHNLESQISTESYLDALHQLTDAAFGKVSVSGKILWMCCSYHASAGSV